MALDVTKLTNDMMAALPQAIQAAQIVGSDFVAKVNSFAPPEIVKLAKRLAAIEQGGFTPALAKSMVESQIEAFRNVLVGMAEVALAAAEKLINELLKIVAGVVNGALNFALL